MDYTNSLSKHVIMADDKVEATSIEAGQQRDGGSSATHRGEESKVSSHRFKLDALLSHEY